MIKFTSYLIGFLILFSCSTSNHVVSNKLLQKRKYKKGWFVNSNERVVDSKGKEQIEVEKEIAFNAISDSSQVTQKSEDKDSATYKTVVGQELEQDSSVSLISQSIERLKNLNPKESIKKKLISFDIQETEGIEVPIYDQDLVAPIDESDKRVLYAILGIFILLLTGIAPLAVFVALGRGEALRISKILYFTGLILMLAFILTGFAVLAATAIGTISLAYSILLGVLGVAAVLMFLFAFVHALVSIIRGF